MFKKYLNNLANINFVYTILDLLDDSRMISLLCTRILKKNKTFVNEMARSFFILWFILVKGSSKNCIFETFMTDGSSQESLMFLLKHSHSNSEFNVQFLKNLF